MKFPSLNQDSAAGSYLKIKDGESVVGIFRGEIFSFKQRWEHDRSVVLDEPDSNKHNRFKLNFLIYENNKFSAKVWEFGITIYNNLAAINAEMPIEKTKIKISRSGSGKDTIYTLVPLGPVNEAALKQIEAVPLNILDNKKTESAPMIDEPMPDSENLPF